jgi:tetratricopeptide (TPR) repeat protein
VITPQDHPHRPNVLTHLANSLLTRFGQIGDLHDLDQAVDAGRKAVAAAKTGGYSQLTNLGCALRDRFERTGNMADVHEAVDACREAVARIPADHPERSQYLSNLGSALRTRHDRTGDLDDLRGAVSILRDASEMIPAGHPMRPGILSNLGVALKKMFDRTGDLQLLEQSVEVHRAAITAIPNANLPRSKAINNLTAALRARYERTGSLGDLDEAIEAAREERTANLVVALNARFWRTGNLADLNEAITASREVVATDPVGLPARGVHLGMLGHALLNRFDRTGDPAALEEAISVDREAVAATPAGHPDRAIHLQSLGTALRAGFTRTGDQSCLDEAIEVGREAVTAAPQGHDMTRSLLASLAQSLMARFRSTGDTASLEESVRVTRAAVAVTPAEHPKRPWQLARLGSGLHALFRRLGLMSDLEEAISLLREAEQALPDGHTKRPAVQESLGAALATLYVETRDIGLLNEALAIDRDALAHTPPDAPGRGARFHSITAHMWRRYEHTRSLDDLAEALRTARQAVEAVPADHPGRAVDLSLLGIILWEQYRRTKTRHFAAEALGAFREAANNDVAPVGIRVSASSSWGRCAATLKDWEQAVNAFGAGTSLLPMLAGRELSRTDQEHQLGDWANLAANGAASAINLGRPDLAVSLLEQGRGVLFSQALETRSDLTELRRHHPTAAEELLRLNRQLDAPVDDYPGGSADPFDSETSAAAERAMPDRHRLVHGRNRLMAEIRDLPGFERFLLPPQIDRLLALGQQGPVICCNVSSHRSDALILDRDGAQVVSLPEVTPERVRANVNKLLAASTGAGLARDKEELLQSQPPFHDVLHWLWDALAQPVLDHLGITDAAQPGQPWPRVWWMPTGLLAFLPIHAAGYHTNSTGRIPMTVIDRVISSYTPTLRALLHGRDQATPTEPPQALVVSMPTTADQSDLRGADEEARILQSHVHRSLILRSEDATADRILAELPAFPWVHFACHAASDPNDPSHGHLLVHDYEQRPLTILDIARVHSHISELAFLSACETARTGLRLADESIHLASSFQLAGYAHVIGTLWPINDYIAVKITENFYEQFDKLMSTDRPHDFAAALHNAVLRARKNYRHVPYLWAAHVHAGC